METRDDTGPGFTYVVSISPAKSLPDDQWAWLRIDAGASPVVKVREPLRATAPDGSVAIALFTGSKPAIDSIARKIGDVADEIDVTFSEPVPLGTLARGFTVTSAGSPVKGCAIQRGECIAENNPTISETATYRVDAENKIGFDSFKLGLADSVTLIGQATAEAHATLHGARVETTNIASTSWVSCETDRMCWHRPLPSSPK
jgi:hypothetical protein